MGRGKSKVWMYPRLTTLLENLGDRNCGRSEALEINEAPPSTLVSDAPIVS